jgi:outer membrane lipoprotein SlyB
MKRLILLTVVLSGCAQYGGYSPTVDAYNDRNGYRLDQDVAECRGIAEQASGGTAQETLKNAGVGSLIGAAGGAIAGAFVGDPGIGAAIGAAAGGFGGGAYKGLQTDNHFQYAYNNCLERRGHTVIR